MPLANTLFIKAQRLCSNRLFAFQTSDNGSGFNAINFIPGKTQISANGFDAAIMQHINGKTLKKSSKSTVLFSPWDTHNNGTVRIAFNAWYTSFNNGSELTCIKMALLTGLKVMHMHPLIAFRACPKLICSTYMYCNCSNLRLKINRCYMPRVLKTQGCFVKFCIFHTLKYNLSNNKTPGNV